MFDILGTFVLFCGFEQSLKDFDWATGGSVSFQFMLLTETEAVKCTKSKL